MTQLTTAPCKVCGSLTQREPELDGLLLRCPDCTFRSTAQLLAEPEKLYDESYFHGLGYPEYFDPTSRRFESRLRLRWLLSTGRVNSLLEAGAAGGFFVDTARAAGIDARGIEVSATAVRYATEVLGVDVQQGLFESATVDEPVEVVCAFHVLEHVEDPMEFLLAARRLLAPGCRLALEVPNIGSAASHRLGAAWPAVEPRYHRWHFTPETLTRLVTAAGFEVVARDTVFSRFYWQPKARRRNARVLFFADLVASHRPSVRHPTMGDALRLVARKVDDSGFDDSGRDVDMVQGDMPYGGKQHGGNAQGDKRYGDGTQTEVGHVSEGQQ